MEIKKKYSFKSDKIIWRIMFSELNKLVIEERDPLKREVFYSCLDAADGTIIFRDLQLVEKFWTGIEMIYKNIIIFHKYGKPDMPGHKAIIVLDINTKKVLWQTDDFVYLFFYDDKIYVFKHKLDDRYYYSLDYRTGKIMEELGNDTGYINSLKDKQYNPNIFFNFLFPEAYKKETAAHSPVDAIFNEYIGTKNIAGNIEYIINGDQLYFNFYEQAEKKNLINKFYTVDLNTRDIIFQHILNENSNAYVPDSFFIKDNLLYLLKDKNEVLVYSII